MRVNGVTDKIENLFVHPNTADTPVSARVPYNALTKSYANRPFLLLPIHSWIDESQSSERDIPNASCCIRRLPQLIPAAACLAGRYRSCSVTGPHEPGGRLARRMNSRMGQSMATAESVASTCCWLLVHPSTRPLRSDLLFRYPAEIDSSRVSREGRFAPWVLQTVSNRPGRPLGPAGRRRDRSTAT